MSYRVEVTEQAHEEARAAFRWLLERSPEQAVKWYLGLEVAIDSLAQHPERCRVAPERTEFDQEIRQLLYGKRGGVYRILFEIRGRVVYVLHVRHGARKALSPEEDE